MSKLQAAAIVQQLESAGPIAADLAANLSEQVCLAGFSQADQQTIFDTLLGTAKKRRKNSQDAMHLLEYLSVHEWDSLAKMDDEFHIAKVLIDH